MTEQTESTVSGKTVLHYPNKNTYMPYITVDTYTMVILRTTFSQVVLMNLSKQSRTIENVNPNLNLMFLNPVT